MISIKKSVTSELANVENVQINIYFNDRCAISDPESEKLETHNATQGFICHLKEKNLIMRSLTKYTYELRRSTLNSILSVIRACNCTRIQTVKIADLI